MKSEFLCILDQRFGATDRKPLEETPKQGQMEFQEREDKYEKEGQDWKDQVEKNRRER